MSTPTTLTLLMPSYPLPALPTAPANLVANPTLTTGQVGARGLTVTYDGSDWPQEVYVNGTTPIVYNFGLPAFQGTGWYPGSVYGPHIPDPSKRQVIINAGSTTPDQMAAVGQAYLAYTSKAKIKATATIGNPDDPVQSDAWAPGQTTIIHDTRLPGALEDILWPIQQVQGSLVPVNDFRVYDLQLGDAPFARFAGMQWTAFNNNNKGPAAQNPLAARTHQIQVLDSSGAPIIGPVTPIPSTPMTLRSQATDPATFNPIQQAGLPVHWEITAVRDQNGTDQTLQGTVSPADTYTDNNGQCTTVFTPSAVRGLVYFIEATTQSVGS